MTSKEVSNKAEPAKEISYENRKIMCNSSRCEEGARRAAAYPLFIVSCGSCHGGIYNDSGQAPFHECFLELASTILNAGASGGTLFNNGGQVTSLGYNLANDAGGGVLTGPGDQINTDPMLGPLQDNGGPTFTHELLIGSTAINAGDPSFTPPPYFDQRGSGFDRVRDGRIDIGSFEVQAGSTPTPTPRPTPMQRPRPTPTPRP
jgi:hypothetical protein